MIQTTSKTHPDRGYSVGQWAHGVSVAGAHDGAVGADEFLFGAAEPVQLSVVRHAQLALTGGDPRLRIGGGRGLRRGDVPLLVPLRSAGQRGENGQLAVHLAGFRGFFRVGRGGRTCQLARYEPRRHGTIAQQVHRENRSRAYRTAQ